VTQTKTCFTIHHHHHHQYRLGIEGWLSYTAFHHCCLTL
jgi:hypothetical protein